MHRNFKIVSFRNLFVEFFIATNSCRVVETHYVKGNRDMLSTMTNFINKTYKTLNQILYSLPKLSNGIYVNKISDGRSASSSL
jgi:hypothetical protein